MATGAVVVCLTITVVRLPWTLLLKPLPYHEPHRLMMLWLQPRKSALPHRGLVTPAAVLDWRDRQQVFSDIAAAELWDGNPTAWVDLADPPERLRGGLVTPNFFELLGVTPLFGHGLDAAHHPLESSVVLGYDLWQRRFGGDRSVLGQSIRLTLGRRNQRVPKLHTITGVLPRGMQFTYPRGTEIWLAHPWHAVQRAHRGAVTYEVIGRLEPGVSRAAAARHMRDLVDSSPADLAWLKDNDTVRLENMTEYVVGSARYPLLLLAAAAIALLVVGAVNVTTLLVSLVWHRRAEHAIHRALGASRHTLALHALVPMAIVVVLGAVAGIVGSVPALALARSLVATSTPRTAELVGADATVALLVTAASDISPDGILRGPRSTCRSSRGRARSCAWRSGLVSPKRASTPSSATPSPVPIRCSPSTDRRSSTPSWPSPWPNANS